MTKEEKLKIARDKLKDGAIPHVPSRVREDQDPSIQALVNIMRECYRHRPELRPTAQRVVEMLQEAIDEATTSGENEKERQGNAQHERGLKRI